METREITLMASPVDPQADVYTFLHPKQDYGVMKTEHATISATIALKAVADGAALANEFNNFNSVPHILNKA